MRREIASLMCAGDFPAAESPLQKGRFVSAGNLRMAAPTWLRWRHDEQHVSGNDVDGLMPLPGAEASELGHREVPSDVACRC